MSTTWNVFGNEEPGETYPPLLVQAYPGLQEETLGRLFDELRPFIERCVRDGRIDTDSIRATADRLDAILREVAVPA